MRWGRLSGLAAVAVGAAAVVVAGTVHPTLTQPSPRPLVQPLTSATLSCPGFPDSTAAATTVFAVSPNPGEAARGDDRLRIVSRGDAAGTLAVTPNGGKPLRIKVSADDGRAGVSVVAGGALAPGVSAAQLSTYSTERVTGMAAAPCALPQSDWWFQAVDTSVGVTSTLVLTNPSPAVSVVDLRFLGPDGRVDALGASGIAVAPRSQLVLGLARFAPNRSALTLEIKATQGTVAAAVAQTRLDGLVPNGAEWLPASAPPAAHVVVNAGVQGVGRQSLVVTNPGPRQELVSVRILDPNGAFTSTRLPDLQVPPGAVVVRDVSAILENQPIAIGLSAPGSVTGALVSRQLGDPRDFAVAGVSQALTAPAVVPAVNGSALTLSFATGSPAPQQVEIRGFTGQGSTVGVTTVTMKGAATTTWRPPDGWAAGYLVLTVQPRSDVHAVASYAGVHGVTQLPVQSAPRTLLRPAIHP